MAVSDKLENVLDVWGGRQLLAFSGLDGPTDHREGLAGHTTYGSVGITVRAPALCRLHIADGTPNRTLLGGDFFEVTTAAGKTRGAFVDAYHLLVEGPCEVRECDDSMTSLEQAGRVLVAPASRFDDGYFHADLSRVIEQRQAWLAARKLPACVHDGVKPSGNLQRRIWTPLCSTRLLKSGRPQGSLKSWSGTLNRWSSAAASVPSASA